MKRAIAMLLSIAAAPLAALAASPAATQSWVRNYVATNTANAASAGFNVAPIAATVTNELGEAETVTLTFGDCRNAAMVVEDSTVSGMTNGTLFARVGEYAYRNTANTACTDFSGANDTFGSVLTDGLLVVSTNGSEIVTNVVYSTTNEVWMVRYVAHVGANVFQSVKIRPGTHLFRSATTDAAFTMRECLVTDAAKARLVTPRASFLSRLASLLCPYAYAATPGEKIPDHDEQLDGLVRHWWKRHNYTDSTEAKHIVVDTVSITSASGQTISYELDVVLIDIPQGVDFCSIADYATVPTEDEIYAAIESAVGRNRAIQLKRSTEWQDHLAEKLNQAYAIIDAINAVTCPEKGFDEEVMPPKPIPPEEHACKFFEGHCGAWMCVECHTWYEGVEDDPDHPAEHDFQITEDGGACQICIVCGSRPSEPDLHGGWHDANVNPLKVLGVDHGCVCDCGIIKLYHLEKAQTVRYEADPGNPLVCREVWECARCHEVVEAKSPFDTGLTMTRTTHDETTNGKFTAVTVPNPLGDEYDDLEVCRLSYTCEHLDEHGESLGCHAARTEDLSHVIAWNDGVVSSQGDAESHQVKMPCVNGFVKWSDDFATWVRDNPNWCGHCEATNKPHKIESCVFEWDDPRYPATSNAHVAARFCGNIATMKHDGVTTCGRLWLTNEAHTASPPTYGDATRGTHAVSNYCGKCFGTFFVGRESHVAGRGDFCNYLSILDHTVSNYCGKCFEFYPVGDGIAPHGESPYHACVYKSQEYHAVSNYCGDCKSWYYAGLGKHAPLYATPTAYVPFGTWTHTESNVCDDCGADYVQRLVVPCKADPSSWTLRDDEASDSVRCEHCINVCEVGHVWIPDGDSSHHCANGAGHKWEPHDFTGPDTDVCRKCGWNGATHERDELPLVTVYCPSCWNVPEALRCAAQYRGGVFVSSDCAHWDRLAKCCTCTMCTLGSGFCECTGIGIFSGPVDGPLAGSNHEN